MPPRVRVGVKHLSRNVAYQVKKSSATKYLSSIQGGGRSFLHRVTFAPTVGLRYHFCRTGRRSIAGLILACPQCDRPKGGKLRYLKSDQELLNDLARRRRMRDHRF